MQSFEQKFSFLSDVLALLRILPGYFWLILIRTETYFNPRCNILLYLDLFSNNQIFSMSTTSYPTCKKYWICTKIMKFSQNSFSSEFEMKMRFKWYQSLNYTSILLWISDYFIETHCNYIKIGNFIYWIYNYFLNYKYNGLDGKCWMWSVI